MIIINIKLKEYTETNTILQQREGAAIGGYNWSTLIFLLCILGHSKLQSGKSNL
jgi:hypothetical protein